MEKTVINSHPYVVTFVAFLIGYLLMPVVMKLAKKYDLVVSPNKRTSHEGKIPYVGGINIFISFLFTVFLFCFSPLSESSGYPLIGLLVVLLVGFVDDIVVIKASKKILGEILGGLFLIVLADVRIVSLNGFLGLYTVDIWTSYLLSFFVFIVVINAINLVDGIDGLASGLGIVYMLFFGLYFQLIEEVELSLTSYALLGSLLIFFLYNVFATKRKLFMGDSGSLLLGYMVVLFSFNMFELNANGIVQPQYKMSAAPAVVFSLLIVPLFDTLRVMFTRMKKGISPFVADRNHVHHLLLSLGLKHMQVTFILIGVTVSFLILALICRNFPIGLLLLIDLVLCLLLTKYLWKKVDAKKELSTSQNPSEYSQK